MRKLLALIALTALSAATQPARAEPPRVTDTTLCPLLAALQGIYLGVLRINSDGDTYIAEVWIWDCPPYSN